MTFAAAGSVGASRRGSPLTTIRALTRTALWRLPPLRPLLEGWQHRSLIFRLARREVQARYRGSALGWLWSLVVPVFLLLIYAFVFGVVFEPRWTLPPGGRGNFALLVFSGIVVFSIFAECAGRAPGLILANTNYVKRVVFPLEILPWVALLSALFNAAMSCTVLLVFYAATVGLPPLTALWLPVCLLPLVLLCLGVSWLLAALGVYFRDLQPLVGVVIAALNFLSPVFYPLTAIPPQYRGWLEVNPVAVVLEATKAALFYGVRPSARALAAATFACLLLAWFARAVFRRLRPGFADVV